MLDENLFTISAATHFGIESWLKRVVTLLRNTKPEEVYQLENIPLEDYKQDQRQMIVEITDQERQKLIDEEYIDPGTYDYAKVREVSHPEICKMVRMTRR
ncbi:MAG: hypothetical protein WCG98_04740 [bacterium]